MDINHIILCNFISNGQLFDHYLHFYIFGWTCGFVYLVNAFSLVRLDVLVALHIKEKLFFLYCSVSLALYNLLLVYFVHQNPIEKDWSHGGIITSSSFSFLCCLHLWPGVWVSSSSKSNQSCYRSCWRCVSLLHFVTYYSSE